MGTGDQPEKTNNYTSDCCRLAGNSRNCSGRSPLQVTRIAGGQLQVQVPVRGHPSQPR